MSENEKLELSEFENLDINELNEILVSDDPRRPEYLDYLRNDGWFAGAWTWGAAVVLPDGRLIPVGEDSQHETTTRRSLKLSGVSLKDGDSAQKLFLDSGGIVVVSISTFASIVGDTFSGQEDKYRTAAKFIASLDNPPQEIMISSKDTSVEINTDKFVTSGFQL